MGDHVEKMNEKVTWKRHRNLHRNLHDQREIKVWRSPKYYDEGNKQFILPKNKITTLEYKIVLTLVFEPTHMFNIV